MKNKLNFVEAIKQFNEVAGTPEVFDKRKAALYTGLVLEEVSEMIASLNQHDDQNWVDCESYLSQLGMNFKKGYYDDVFDDVDRESFLDASVDIAVVSLGAGIAIGADIEGACSEVMETNLNKFPIIDGKRTVLKDSNGKVKKPDGWTGPNLAEYLK